MAHAAPQITLEVAAEESNAASVLEDLLTGAVEQTDKRITVTHVPVGPGESETVTLTAPSDTLPALGENAFEYREVWEGTKVKVGDTPLNMQWLGDKGYAGAWKQLGWTFRYSPYNEATMDEVHDKITAADAINAAADAEGYENEYYLNVRTV